MAAVSDANPLVTSLLDVKGFPSVEENVMCFTVTPLDALSFEKYLQ